MCRHKYSKYSVQIVFSVSFLLSLKQGYLLIIWKYISSYSIPEVIYNVNEYPLYKCPFITTIFQNYTYILFGLIQKIVICNPRPEALTDSKDMPQDKFMYLGPICTMTLSFVFAWECHSLL